MARVRGSDFGETVLAVRADDSELRATLTKDEAFVRQSTAKMQGSLNKLNVPMKSLGASSITVGGTFAVMGAAVSVFGGNIGATIGPVIALTGALAALGATASAVAIPLTLVAAILFRQQLADLIEGVGAAEAALAATEAKLQEKFRARKAAEAALEKARRDREAAEAKALADRLRLLDQEIAVLEGRAKATDFITDAMERQRTIQRDTVIFQQQQAQLARDELRARQQMVVAELRAQGPQTAAQAAADIDRALLLEQARQTGIELLVSRTKELLAIGRITQEEFAFAQKHFDLGAPESQAELADRVGGISLPATRFTDIGAFAGGARDPAAKRDEARNKKLDMIIRLQQRGVRLN
ncbi:hypothetical protein LCGC14_1693030 [marine sediment metagenome]|uniref:Uncharacterized protein n=1 Tax=marine sediment metagenome TaxID=412755 RepID=A0A0F9KKB3_9ZZZZ